MEEAETVRCRICLEQSLKTVCDHMSSQCPLTHSVSLHLLLLLSPFALSSLSCITAGLQRCEQKAADVTHYFRRRTCCTEKSRTRVREGERLDSLLRHLFSQAIIYNHE